MAASLSTDGTHKPSSNLLIVVSLAFERQPSRIRDQFNSRRAARDCSGESVSLPLMSSPSSASRPARASFPRDTLLRAWTRTDLPFDLRPYVRIVLLQQAHKNAMRRRPVGARMRKLPADHRVAKHIAVDERMGERNVHAAADIALRLETCARSYSATRQSVGWRRTLSGSGILFSPQTGDDCSCSWPLPQPHARVVALLARGRRGLLRSSTSLSSNWA
jgi:hypothetical protein